MPNSEETSRNSNTRHTEPIYVSGEGGYHTFRIPAAVVTAKGTVLAFAEGRRNSASDTGDIDLVLRRSEDRGGTWSDPQIVWDDGPNTCGNPCPVVDHETGTVWLACTWNLGSDHEGAIINRDSQDTRRVFVLRSNDDGLTWSAPREITDSVKKPEWTWYATGPGAGIQLRQSDAAGRLMIPCDHMIAHDRRYWSHVFYSDDHGETWQVGGSVGDMNNECEVVELADGSIMLNARHWASDRTCRVVAISEDAGETWTKRWEEPLLVDPRCAASIRRYSLESDGSANRLLFLNAASTKRERMTLHLSLDEGRSWAVSRVLHDGPAAYSCLAVGRDGEIFCFYEAGEKHPYETITLDRVGLDWLTAKP